MALPEIDREWLASEEFRKRAKKILDDMEKSSRELEKARQLTPLDLLTIWCD